MSVNERTSLPHKPGTETPRGWKLAAWLLTKQRNQERDGEEEVSKEGGGGVKYACTKLQTRVTAVTAESSPRLAVIFTPIISAASHPVPDINILVVNVLILSICHMLLCLLGRLCHKELTFITNLKVPVISKMSIFTPTLENKM